MRLSPIILFAYNRPWHTRQTVEALLKNRLAEASDLFIFSDAPKDEADKINVDEVKKYLKSIKGFKSLKIIERQRNYGLAKSIITGVTEIINIYGKAIVVEDDLITSPYFLEYMNDALNFYNNNESVISISAYIYPVKARLPETLFLKGAYCWGWATWKRGWDLFENDGQKLLNEITNKKLGKEFDYDNSYPFTEMLKDQIAGKVDSWAIKWQASAFVKNKLTLYPGKPLVKNIGFDNSGTHCSDSTKYDTVISQNPVTIKNIPVRQNRLAVKAIKKYFNSLRPNIIKRLKIKFNEIKRNFIYPNKK